ncbi:hypothetical protein [Streptomyces olindensis]|uniref:hypothetical protein n=1 Tax=Streptomyces olindensis TaxID=358823 RepID=UPI003663345A
MYDRYERRLQDLPLAGHAVRILLSVRRFVCADDACPKRTFAEQIPGLTSPYARVTDRLGALLDRIALALAGRAGARMASAMGLAAGRMGLLNRIRAMPDPPLRQPAHPRRRRFRHQARPLVRHSDHRCGTVPAHRRAARA